MFRFVVKALPQLPHNITRHWHINSICGHGAWYAREYTIWTQWQSILTQPGWVLFLTGKKWWENSCESAGSWKKSPLSIPIILEEALGPRLKASRLLCGRPELIHSSGKAESKGSPQRRPPSLRPLFLFVSQAEFRTDPQTGLSKMLKSLFLKAIHWKTNTVNYLEDCSPDVSPFSSCTDRSKPFHCCSGWVFGVTENQTSTQSQIFCNV